MHSLLSFPLLLLLLLLPLAACFPAQPAPNVLHPRHIHHTFLQLKARRIRHATARIGSYLATTDAQLAVSSRVGLAFEPCSAADECRGGRSCVQLAGDTSGGVDLADCESGLCFCADTVGCSSTADCLDGETCASGGTCVSNAFVPNAEALDDPDPSLGLNLDPCESIADCQNPRNCVQFEEGVFGQCTGPNCFCVRLDPSCTSTSECSQGESCTQREGSNNAICISETAIINGDTMDEEIEEIPAIVPALPSLPDMTQPEAPAAPADDAPEEPADDQTPDGDSPPEDVPMPVPQVPSSTPTTAPEEVPATAAPATTPAAAPAATPAAAPAATPAAAPAATPAADPAATPAADPAATPAAAPAATPVTTPAPVADPTPVSTPADGPAAPTDVDDTTPPEAEQDDREPDVVIPGADGADVSPDMEEGEEVGPSDSGVEEGEDGELSATPGEDGIIDGPGVSPTPELEDEDEGEGEEGPSASPEDVICIGEHHLVHMARDELLYSSNRVARVLCDDNNSCATPGHIVTYNGKPMMMSSYCSETTCAPRIMKVNSPRYRRAARVESHTDGLHFTAFAARYETRAEEHLLRTFVHMGL